MEIAIGEPGEALCWACKEAGCELGTAECAVLPELEDPCEEGHKWAVGTPADSPYCLRCGIPRHPVDIPHDGAILGA